MATVDDASDLSDDHNLLLLEVLDATEAYEAVTKERDLQDEDADLAKAMKLNRQYYEANIRLLRAERDYYAYEAETKQFQKPSYQYHAEAKTFESLKAANEASQQQKVPDCQAHAEEIQTLERQAQLDHDTIASLRDQLQLTKLNTARSTLAQRRENTELTGFNNLLSWEAAHLTSRIREVECLNEQLQYEDEMLDMNRFEFNPNWEDPKPKDVEGAIATRALAKALAWHFGGSELLVAVDEQPMKSVKGEIDRVRALLEKYGVLLNVFANERFERGESPRLL